MVQIFTNYFDAAKYARDVPCKGRKGGVFLFLLENATRVCQSGHKINVTR